MPHGLKHRDRRWVVGLLLLGLIIRVIIAIWLHPGFDEAYYYLYTLHPDWSYFDHPPLVGVITALGPWVLGDVSGFSIRLGSLLLYTGSLLFLYLAAEQLFSAAAGLLTVALATAVPIFQIGFGILTLPDSPLVFFWSATLYVAACEFFPSTHATGICPYQPSSRVALISLLVGLASLGKYHGFALGFGLVCFCLLSSTHRRVFLSPWLPLGFALFLLALTPVLIWNLQHDWISLRFQSGRALPASGYRLGDLLLTVLTGIGLLFPTLGVPLWWISLRATGLVVWSRLQGLGLGSEGWKQVLILCISLPLVIGFTFMGGYRQILPTWPMPGFWGLTILLGHQATFWQQPHPQWVRRWLWGSGMMVTVLMVLTLVHTSAGLVQKPGNYSFLGQFWAAESDPSTQLIDIRQLRQGFVTSPILKTALEASDFVFTNRYFLGGQIGMALQPLGDHPLTCFDSDLRGFAFWSTPDQWLGQNALYVTSALFQQGEDPVARYGDYFESLTPIGEIPIRRGGEVVQTFLVYEAKQLLKPYPRPYG